MFSILLFLPQLARRDISKAIGREMSGDLEDAFKAISKYTLLSLLLTLTNLAKCWMLTWQGDTVLMYQVTTNTYD